MSDMTVGQRIRERRKELGLSQEELARRLGNKSRASVCTVEKDKEDLTTERIRKYAEALDCTPAFLMGWEDERGDKTPYKKLLDAYERNERIAQYSPEQLIEALDFLDAYQQVPPETRAAIKLLLTARQPES